MLIIDPGDSTIKVGHEFFGLTEKEVRHYMREHASHCDYFQQAIKDGRVIEEIEEIDEEDLPDVNEEFDEEEFEEEEA